MFHNMTNNNVDNMTNKGDYITVYKSINYAESSIVNDYSCISNQSLLDLKANRLLECIDKQLAFYYAWKYMNLNF